MQEIKSIPLVAPLIDESYASEVYNQILSGFLGPGSRSQEFGQMIGAFANAPFTLLTVSGTVALSIAAIALDLSPGDEIIVPAYGVISTINAFASIGLKPKLVEIELETGCISLEHLKKTISRHTRAVCFVNFSGYTGENLVAIKAFCDEKGIPLIEDAACALGHQHKGIHSGLFGTVGIYSFSVPKILTTGQGGVLITREEAIFKKAAAYIDQGDLEWRKTNRNHGIGTNLRFNDVLAAFGCAQMRKIESLLIRRKEVHLILKDVLKNKLFSVPGEEAPLHNIVFPENPLEFIAELKNEGIGCSRGYATLSSHPAYQHLEGHFPTADFWMNHAVFLPFGVSLDTDDAKYIGAIVNKTKIKMHTIR